MNLKSPVYVPGHDLIKGKSVLITAAAGAGIGFSAAIKAAQEGARAIVLSDIHEARLATAVEKLKQESGLAEVYGKVGNVAVEEDVRALVNFAEENVAGVDILINNAGLGSSKLLIEMEDDEWNRVIDVTLNGTMRMTRYMMKVMKAHGRGGRYCQQCICARLACTKRAGALRSGEGRRDGFDTLCRVGGS